MGSFSSPSPLLPEDEITFVEERVDRLYDRWDTLPRRLTRGPSGEAIPPIARVHWLNALDPVLAHCQLLETCRGMAAVDPRVQPGLVPLRRRGLQTPRGRERGVASGFRLI